MPEKRAPKQIFARMRIIIDDKIPYIKGIPESLGFEAVYVPGAAITAADVHTADAMIIRTRTRVDASLLEGSCVKCVITATIGYDHIDTSWLESHGIYWTNCPGCNASSVAQYFRSSMLILSRRGIIDLKDCTVGVVGVGHVGSLIRDAAAALGCRLLLCDPPLRKKEGGSYVALGEIASKADVITFHVPLTRSGLYPTFHMADGEFFSSLERRPVVINAARGAVVDDAAWLTALENGKVRAAVIDTWENEPHISQDLLEKALIATPHIAGYSADGKANATRMSLEALCKFFSVEPRFSVRPPLLPASLRRPDDCAERELALYNPMSDTAALKSSPSDFEKLRGNYPLRREIWEQAGEDVNNE